MKTMYSKTTTLIQGIFKREIRIGKYFITFSLGKKIGELDTDKIFNMVDEVKKREKTFEI